MKDLWKEPRPCIVTQQGEPRPAFFHLFTTSAYVIAPSPLKGGHPGGQCSDPCAIVEYESGEVGIVLATSVHFLDTKHLMAQYDWGDKHEERSCETCKHYKESRRTRPCDCCEDVNDIPSLWEAKG